ncbi:MAG TPA: hypothetical protein DCP32_05510 [Anaerolineaceae bacterium]|nr:MAG: hypothetical protein A2X24_03295 [Chloroflexi bacterium GWB2_54_36]HAL16213.1 hypothetical protein [Anaerolineaceae bacterium]HBA92123.1 hypothetical protein [Anaerolineaceae bacterium]
MEEKENFIQSLLSEPLVAINLGLVGFGEAILDQQAEVVLVDWFPPAGGDQGLIDLLDQLL